VATNYQRAKEWLRLAFNNIERVIRDYKLEDYAGSIFRIQLSIEQLQKSLIFLLGLHFKKTHEPSKILKSFTLNQNQKIDESHLKKIHDIAKLAQDIENEETKTRYGVIEHGKLITPEDRYDRGDSIQYLKDLGKITKYITELYQEFEDFNEVVNKLKEYYNQLSMVISDE